MDQQSRAMVSALIALQDALGGHYGALSRPKLRLMLKLADQSPTISELAERLNISSPGVSQMIDKLQAEGLVSRQNPSSLDQRVVSVSLTAEGRKVLIIAEEAFLHRVQTLLQPLTAEETLQLYDLLQKVTHITIPAGKKMNPS
jgi:DNA-binding MarR family transcriptional regulator